MIRNDWVTVCVINNVSVVFEMTKIKIEKIWLTTSS